MYWADKDGDCFAHTLALPSYVATRHSLNEFLTLLSLLHTLNFKHYTLHV